MRTKNKYKAFKLLGAIAVLILGGIISLNFPSANISAFASEPESPIFSEQLMSTAKIESRVTIDQAFDGTSVMVVLDRSVSGINKRHSKTFFGDIEIASVEDLSTISNSTKTFIDEKNFEQVLKITLPQDCKETVISTIRQLEKINGIKYAGPNRYLELRKTPNDEYYSNPGQWGLEKIQAPLAWDITTGSSTVRVGVIDSEFGHLINGQASHPDLNTNLRLSEGGNFVYPISGTNTYPSPLKDIGNGDGGHGTHVAGIVGAAGDNKIGVSGVNWNVSLVPMQVVNFNYDVDSAACVRAVKFATETLSTNQPIKILNFSIGASFEWPEIETEIRKYSNAGGLFICAAENKAVDHDVIYGYPLFYGSTLHTNRIENMIIVGRSNTTDAHFNSRGANTITLYAPGQSILSTTPLKQCEETMVINGVSRKRCSALYYDWQWNYVDTGHYTNGYHFYYGTSMATPMVAGVAALMLSVNSNLTAAQIKSIIMSSVDVIPALNNHPTYGKLCVTGGRLNAYRAVSSVALKMSENTIVGLHANAASDVRYIFIPNTFNGTAITAIGASAFANRTYLSQIEIPASVTSIASNAFDGCANLTNITKLSYAFKSANMFGTSFSDWQTLENLPVIDYRNLYYTEQELSVKYTASFDVFGSALEYELRLINFASGTVFSKAAYTWSDGQSQTRTHTFDSVALANLSDNPDLQIQIRYKSKVALGLTGCWLFAVRGNKVEMGLIHDDVTGLKHGKIYMIKNMQSGLYLGASGGYGSAFVQTTFQGVEQQMFTAMYHEQSNTFSFIPCHMKASCIGVTNGYYDIQPIAANVSFIIYSWGDGRYTIHNGGKVMSVAGSGQDLMVHAQPVVAQNFNADALQQFWAFEEVVKYTFFTEESHYFNDLETNKIYWYDTTYLPNTANFMAYLTGKAALNYFEISLVQVSTGVWGYSALPYAVKTDPIALWGGYCYFLKVADLGREIVPVSLTTTPNTAVNQQILYHTEFYVVLRPTVSKTYVVYSANYGVSIYNSAGALIPAIDMYPDLTTYAYMITLNANETYFIKYRYTDYTWTYYTNVTILCAY